MQTYIFLALLIGNIISNEKAGGITEYTGEYFPLDVTKTIVYNSNFDISVFNVKARGDSLIMTNSADDFKYEQSMIKRTDGVYLTRTEQEVDLFLFFSSHKVIKYNEPALRFPFPLTIGMTWRWEGYEIVDSDSLKIEFNCKAVCLDTINTEAGKFECIKIVSEIGSADDKKDIITEWLAFDVGIVRMIADVKKEGIVGFVQDLLGLDKLEFEIKEIKQNAVVLNSEE